MLCVEVETTSETSCEIMCLGISPLHTLKPQPNINLWCLMFGNRLILTL